MITVQYAQLMARYNRWMNRKLYSACDSLSDEQRKALRGAFFGSLHSTLNHLLWADYVWIGRFARGTPLGRNYPKGAIGSDLYSDWEALGAARAAMDDDILAWAAALDAEWLARDFSWFSAAKQSTRCAPAWLLVTHLFNHQTHHRGQATTLLSQYGIDPGETDLAFMPIMDGG